MVSSLSSYELVSSSIPGLGPFFVWFNALGQQEFPQRAKNMHIRLIREPKLLLGVRVSAQEHVLLMPVVGRGALISLILQYLLFSHQYSDPRVCYRWTEEPRGHCTCTMVTTVCTQALESIDKYNRSMTTWKSLRRWGRRLQAVVGKEWPHTKDEKMAMTSFPS